MLPLEPRLTLTPGPGALLWYVELGHLFRMLILSSGTANLAFKGPPVWGAASSSAVSGRIPRRLGYAAGVLPTYSDISDASRLPRRRVTL